MRFAGFECESQRLARPDEMRLPDYVIQASRAQRFSERWCGCAFAEKVIHG